MHEMSIAQSLMDIIREEMDKNDLSTLLKVKIKTGRLNAIVPDALIFCFDMLIKDTPWEGAIMEIETIPVKMKCCRCGGEFMVPIEEKIGALLDFPCPHCGMEFGHTLIEGKELLIEYIEGE